MTRPKWTRCPVCDRVIRAADGKPIPVYPVVTVAVLFDLWAHFTTHLTVVR